MQIRRANQRSWPPMTTKRVSRIVKIINNHHNDRSKLLKMRLCPILPRIQGDPNQTMVVICQLFKPTSGSQREIVTHPTNTDTQHTLWDLFND